MPLYKRKDGRVRDDQFTTSLPPGYIVAPLNRYSFTGSSMQLDHDNIDDIRVLVDLPGACAVEITADYTPIQAGDKGGLILFNNSDQTSEFLEQVDVDTASNVLRWRTKSNDGASWDFFADSGGGFNFIDSVVEFNPKKVGVVLKKGTGSGYVPLALKRITITTSDILTVANVTSGWVVELLDASNQLVVSGVPLDGVVSLMLPKLSITGKIRIKNGATIVEELSGDFSGGDQYDIGSPLKIVVDATTKEELSITTLTDIGLMVNGVLERKFYLYNPTGTAALNASIGIEMYNAVFGYQWADVAKDASGVPQTYGDLITYPSVTGGAVVPFWLKLTQASGYQGQDRLKFYLTLQHA